MALLIVCSNAPGGPSIGAIQEITPNRLRGRVTAMYYAVISLVGISTGPLVIGAMNDFAFRDEKSVGLSLSVLALLLLPPASALLFWAGRKRRALNYTG
jgi:MFS family permease